MVAGHCKLGVFLLDDEIREHTFFGKFVAESDAVVIHAETQIHLAVATRLVKFHKQLVVIVADIAVLAPHRLPGLVERRCGG